MEMKIKNGFLEISLSKKKLVCFPTKHCRVVLPPSRIMI